MNEPSMLVDDTSAGGASLDIYARLLKDRIVVLGAPMDDAMANLISAQLIHLESEDSERDISLFINSPGGSATALFGVYDAMQHVGPEVATFCVGKAASAAAVLLAAGAPGKRYALPHARILLHHPHGEIGGGAVDIEIHAKEIRRQRGLVEEILSRHTGQPLERVAGDMDRDFILSPEEAREYGVIDDVIGPRDLPRFPLSAL
jgi:ATP-dependent Clp protease protease subunit